MASGLKKAETNEHEPKLFKVAGGIRPVMTEVSAGDRILPQAKCHQQSHKLL